MSASVTCTNRLNMKLIDDHRELGVQHQSLHLAHVIVTDLLKTLADKVATPYSLIHIYRLIDRIDGALLS